MQSEHDHKLNPNCWVDKYSDELYRFALVRINDMETAQDIIQDTFLAALKNLNNYKGETSERNWLYLILKNKIIDYYRSKSKKIIDELPEEDDSFYGEFFSDNGHWKQDALPKPWEQKTDSHSRLLEFYEILDKCKSKLNDIQKIIFAMKFIDEIDSEDICKELKLASSNYWVIIHRTKLKMRKCFENFFYKD